MKARYYAVDFSSALGKSIQNYIDQCNNCNASICDFLRMVEQKYGFPLAISDNTQYCISDDCDAGGLLAIIIPKNEYLAASHTDRSNTLWNAIPSPDDDKMLCLFPRVETETHYIRFGEAMRLHNREDIHWTFAPPTKRDIEKGLKIHAVTYDEVRRFISKRDKDALVKKPGATPSPSVRLAVGRKYVLCEDGVKVGSINPDYFADAIALYREWTSLPCVSSNSLTRILGLKALTDSQVKDPDICFCDWHIDKEHHRFIIHTGLHSDLLTDEIKF